LKNQRKNSSIKGSGARCEELLGAAGGNWANAATAARGKKLVAANEIAKETQRRLQERAVAGAKAADNYIRGNPYHLLAWPFGVGMLIGVIAARRK